MASTEFPFDVDPKEILKAAEEPPKEPAKQDDEPAPTPVELTATEKRAQKKGWSPEQEWTGDPEDWVPAKEYLARGKLYDAIHKSNRRVKLLEDQLKTLADHHAKTEESTYKQAVAEVRRELAKARREQDWDRVEALEEKTEELKELKPAPDKPKADVDQELNAATFTKWQEDNPWYGEDSEKREFAIGMAYAIKQQNPTLTFEETLEKVSERVESHFTVKAKPKRTAAPVASARAKPADDAASGKSKLPSFKQLPDEAKQIYSQLVKTKNNPYGVLSHEQYMKDYLANHGPILEE